jgi:hypothetical protein
MKAMSKAVSLLAISVALTFSGSHVFAGNGSPGQVKTSGTSAAPSGSGAGGNQSQKHACHNGGTGSRCIVAPTPGHTQPPCRGGHKGPNGVMIQCQ